MPEKIQYTLKLRKNARDLRVAIYPGGEIVVTAPKYIAQHIIDDFIAQKADWIRKKWEHQRTLPKRKSLKERQQEFKQYKKQARALIEKRLAYFNSFYGFRYNKIYIRNQSSRWGSCSTKKNLSFNYRLVLISAELADYVVVHELCHLKEMNHSKRFWALVAQTIPDYKNLRKELKKISLRA